MRHDYILEKAQNTTQQNKDQSLWIKANAKILQIIKYDL